MAEAARRKNHNALAVIVIALLVVMGLIALVEGDGFRRAGDSGETMPVDKGGAGAIMPEPNPGAPAPARAPQSTGTQTGG